MKTRLTLLQAHVAHRGPGGYNVVVRKSFGCAHSRLSIVDLQDGWQPFLSGEHASVCNGEICNFQDLKKKYSLEADCMTNSDCEVLIHLFHKLGNDFVKELRGMFAFAILGPDTFFVARDPLGIKPLYFGNDSKGNTWFASEILPLSHVCTDVNEFPPGHVSTGEGGLRRYYFPLYFDFVNPPRTPDGRCSSTAIREGLQAAVDRRLMADVPIGVFLCRTRSSRPTSSACQAARLSSSLTPSPTRRTTPCLPAPMASTRPSPTRSRRRRLLSPPTMRPARCRAHAR